MAFLCPVRIKRNKKKKPMNDESVPGLVPSMGRITGSASIETLVRVGIEKENGVGPDAKMVVLHDFTPCVDDELEVKRGQIVHVLYQENDWVYVISEENQEGFIPNSYCAQYGSEIAMLALNVRKKIPRDGTGNLGQPPNASTNIGKATSMNGLPTTSNLSTAIPTSEGRQHPSEPTNLQNNNNYRKTNMLPTSVQAFPINSRAGGMSPAHFASSASTNLTPHRPNSLMSEGSSQPDVRPFYKESSGRYVVLYTYQAQDENDLSVQRGQCVTVLNSDDPDWSWIATYDGCEGFVPSGFIYPLDAISRQQGFNFNQRPQTNGLPVTPVKQQGSAMSMGPASHSTTTSSSSNNNINNNSSTMQPLNSAGHSSGPPSYSTTAVSSLVSQNTMGLNVPNPGGFSPGSYQQAMSQGDGRFNGTELVMLYDFKAQASDDLTVRRGEIVYADLSNQTVDGWLWTYSPLLKKYGFIPKAYARPPVMTSL